MMKWKPLSEQELTHMLAHHGFEMLHSEHDYRLAISDGQSVKAERALDKAASHAAIITALKALNT